MEKWIFAAVYLVIINLMTFIAYGMDKRKAKKGKWRIPEKTLLLFAVVGGTIGALGGMYFWRHKTKHAKFTIGVPLILIVQIGAAIYLIIK